MQIDKTLSKKSFKLQKNNLASTKKSISHSQFPAFSHNGLTFPSEKQQQQQQHCDFRPVRKTNPYNQLTVLRKMVDSCFTEEDVERCLQVFVGCAPFIKHSMLQELNSLSMNFLAEDSLFKGKRFYELSARLKQESVMNRELNRRQLVTLLNYVLQGKVCRQMFSVLEFLVATASGPTIRNMLCYTAAYISSVTCNFACTFRYLNMLLLDSLSSNRLELLVIYLKATIFNYSNLSNPEKCLQYLKKLLKVSWYFSLQEVEMWTYHQMSKVYLSLQDLEKSKLFRDKFDVGLPETPNSKFMIMCCEALTLEFETMRRTLSDFQIQTQDMDMNMLSKVDRPHPASCDSDHPDSQNAICKSATSLKNFKQVLLSLSKQRRINHLSTLFPKLVQEREKNKEQRCYNTTLCMTHLSNLKNFNNYFRLSEDSKWDANEDKFYTIENPSVSWPLIRQMLRRLVVELMAQ